MEPRIKGFIEHSCSDWPGLIAAVLFLPGCNFRCPYCHNHPLILEPDSCRDYSREHVFSRLRALEGWLDGVCISGGEPTLHPGLPGLCRQIRETGLRCKLDTNGSRPEVVEHLLTAGLLDFVAVDIKAPLRPEVYRRCAGVDVDLGAIRRTMDLVRCSGVEYQFRTTYHPALFPVAELAELAELFLPGETPVLQNARPAASLDPEFSHLAEIDDETFQGFKELFFRQEKKVGQGKKVVDKGNQSGYNSHPLQLKS